MPPPIRVYFLGTGGTTPFSLRNMPCIAVKYEEYLLQFDFGEYCQYGLIRYGLHPFRSKTYIMISHFHADHVGGLPTFLHTYNLVNVARPLTMIGPEGLRVFLETIAGLFGLENVMEKIRIIEVWQESLGRLDKVVEEKTFEIYAFSTVHGVPSIGFVLLEKDRKKFNVEKAKVLGIPPGPLRKRLMMGESIRIENRIIEPTDVVDIIPGRKIVYTGDTMVFDELVDIIKGADLLIHEATYIKSKHESYARERLHATVEDVCILAKKAGVKRLALVHISPRYQKSMEEIENIAKSIVENKVELIIPEDGQILEL